MPTVNAHPASQRGVEGNAPSWPLALMRLGFGALRRISRPAAVAALTRLFVTPRRHAPPARELAVLTGGRRETVTQVPRTESPGTSTSASTPLAALRLLGNQRGCLRRRALPGAPIRTHLCQYFPRAAPGERRLALWRFAPLGGPTTQAGARPPVALLVHGWEGRGSQLGALVQPLRERGFEVALFDHVGHGASEGRRSSMFAMRDGIAAIAEHLGAERVRAVVAHSLGSAAVTLALDGGVLSAPRLVYVAPPYDLVRYFGRYLELAVGDQDLLPDMLRRMERRFGASIEDVHYDNLLPRRREPLLVLHSPDDLDVTEGSARAVAEGWPGGRLEAFDGLGHRRILRDAAVIERATAFLAADPEPALPPNVLR